LRASGARHRPPASRAHDILCKQLNQSS
jgi:hypothetical protein